MPDLIVKSYDLRHGISDEMMFEPADSKGTMKYSAVFMNFYNWGVPPEPYHTKS